MPQRGINYVFTHPPTCTQILGHVGNAFKGILGLQYLAQGSFNMLTTGDMTHILQPGDDLLSTSLSTNEAQ